MNALDDMALGILLAVSFIGGLGLVHVADGWKWRYRYVRYAALHAYSTGDFVLLGEAIDATAKEAREAMQRVQSEVDSESF